MQATSSVYLKDVWTHGCATAIAYPVSARVGVRIRVRVRKD